MSENYFDKYLLCYEVAPVFDRKNKITMGAKDFCEMFPNYMGMNLEIIPGTPWCCTFESEGEEYEVTPVNMTRDEFENMEESLGW